MEQLPLWYEGQEAGAAALERQPPYTCLRVRVPARAGLWCAWAVGDAGEVKIGVLEPSGTQAVIERRLSRQALAPAGRLLRVEVRSSVGPEPDRFRDPDLRRLAELPGFQSHAAGNRRALSVPASLDAPFPLPAWFCFFRMETLNGESRWTLAVNGDEQPMPEP